MSEAFVLTDSLLVLLAALVLAVLSPLVFFAYLVRNYDERTVETTDRTSEEHGHPN